MHRFVATLLAVLLVTVFLVGAVAMHMDGHQEKAPCFAAALQGQGCPALFTGTLAGAMYHAQAILSFTGALQTTSFALLFGTVLFLLLLTRLRPCLPPRRFLERRRKESTILFAFFGDTRAWLAQRAHVPATV